MIGVLSLLDIEIWAVMKNCAGRWREIYGWQTLVTDDRVGM